MDDKEVERLYRSIAIGSKSREELSIVGDIIEKIKQDNIAGILDEASTHQDIRNYRARAQVCDGIKFLLNEYIKEGDSAEYNLPRDE